MASREGTSNLGRIETSRSAARDPEKGTSETLNGFPKVAAWSSVIGNSDTASDLYKVFHRSSTRNLLYLQTRVAALKQKQNNFDQEDYEFRIKNWDAQLHDEDDILDNFFSPSPELLDEVENRLEVLESFELEVSKWEESIRLQALGLVLSGDSPRGEAMHGVPDVNPVVGDSIHQPDATAPLSLRDAVQASEGVSSEQNGKFPWFRRFIKARTQKSSSVELGNLDTASLEQTSIQIEPTEVYADIHDRLDSLEGSRNNSPLGIPNLPQDLSWGPVSDRGPQVSSRVPNDFLLHRECIYQHPSKRSSFQIPPESFFDRHRDPSSKATEKNYPRNECICYRAYRESRKEYHTVLEEGLQAGKGSQIIQMFQQRIRVLEDYYRGLWSIHGQTSRPNQTIPEDKLPKATPPSLAIVLAAKSWEDFEIFGSAVKMWERRGSWDRLNPGQPWPFDMSDEWIGRMRERFNIARDMQVAIKEYHEALVLQSQVMAYERPAPRTIMNASLHHSSSQFRNSSRELLSNPKDLRLIESGPGDGPWLVRELSEFFATKFPCFFLNREVASPNEKHISETKIYYAVTGVILFLLILFLVIATWIVKVLGDLITKAATAQYFAFVTDMQLMVITVFMLIFSVFIVFLGASRFEAFTATAAYAAVLVIFMAPTGPYFA